MKSNEFNILYAIEGYLKQLGLQNFNVESFIDANTKLAQTMVLSFKERFNPKTPHVITSLKDEILKIDAKFHNTALILDNLLHKSIVRTNYFLNRSYISFKVNLSLFDQNLFTLPKPLTFREIYIFGDEFEAIHLRNGKIARGGLRWSDRKDDFRTEVLGLVKTQNTKNTIVVPVGSKGGFVVKKYPEGISPKEALKFGEECYKKFITALLEITDNVFHGELKTPEGIVRYDEEDPYLAVASDKGTASFSDIANEISLKFNFWLGDAFASGGSAGYNHKKIGITSKGAFVSTKRHFYELGLDVFKDEFTVIGVGDMSGDVFGNGLLSSNKMKLIFAFNHLHIFVDPNPNPEVSFKERERMFNLPSSTWQDYDLSKASTGAMLLKRSDKTCTLTPEIMSLFNLKDSTITPEDLIKTALKYKFDLFWNGGIGTYIKASFESSADVGDKVNDVLRINGNELGAKIVAEGGNLGFTQYGRVEYELAGGMINTDAIDNSAGVDCSDHEVNIKILLNALILKGEMTTEARNTLIEDLTGEVEELVLADNRSQTLALSVEKMKKNLDKVYPKFIQHLENTVHLDAKNEKLPTSEDVIKRGLTRPEFAILMAYSKMDLYNALIGSKLINDSYCEKFLIEYFPHKMKEKFLPQIKSHRLKNEIISTVMSNRMVNFGGISIIFEALEQSKRSIDDVMKAYFIADKLLNLEAIFKDIKNSYGKIKAQKQYEIVTSIQNKVLMPAMVKILSQNNELAGINEMTDKISKEVKAITIDQNDLSFIDA